MELTEKHGQLVRPGKVGTSDFVRGFSTQKGKNSYFAGSWEDLEALCEKHFANHEPGTGSVNGDVILVNVPKERFFTSVVAITEDNEQLVETVVTKRAEGEASYETRVIRGKKVPAAAAQIVLYRADVLAQDDDRSTDCEWEIVSVNANPGYRVPMSPTTMARNENHEAGGTKRSYTEQQWAESIEFWKTHATIWED